MRESELNTVVVPVIASCACTARTSRPRAPYTPTRVRVCSLTLTASRTSSRLTIFSYYSDKIFPSHASCAYSFLPILTSAGSADRGPQTIFSLEAFSSQATCVQGCSPYIDVDGCLFDLVAKEISCRFSYYNAPQILLRSEAPGVG